MSAETRPTGDERKSCCAALYASDWARLLLGESLHPGGLALTERLGRLLGLRSGLTVLDVASGPGSSAVHLARTFGCRVIGVDFGAEQIARAEQAARGAGVEALVEFRPGDAERLPLPDGSVDAVVCECAFCTFPDKPAAAREAARVLRSGGRLGLSDVTRSGPLPPELETLFGQLACLGSAAPVEVYADHLRAAGFGPPAIERQDAALTELLRQVRGKLVGTELLVKLGQLELPLGDLEQARRLARAAADSIQAGRLGYALLIATRP